MSKKISDKKPTISFYSKQSIVCPICLKQIKKEEMLTGSGRMNAGDLTDELRRTYIPSAKYGPVYPYIYAVGTCPNCKLSLFWNDFTLITKADIEKIKDIQDTLYEDASHIFPYADFERNKTLLDAGASYYMALLCYNAIAENKNISTTMKRALICLRLAWLSGDVEALMPDHNYNYIQDQFYTKALFFYEQAMYNETNGIEKITNIQTFGPDTDKNYGFDGVVYLSGVLEFKYGQTDNMELRLSKMNNHKRALSRMFGFGRSNKAKPGPFLEIARVKFEAYKQMLENAGKDTTDTDDDEE